MSGIQKLLEDDNWLSKEIDNYLSGISNTIKSKGRVFYASSLGNLCDRFLYYHFLGHIPEEPISAKLRRIFDHGIVTQERYAKYLIHIGRYIKSEISVKLDFPPISGRLDILLKGRDMKLFILEVKTINTTEFKKLQPNKAKEEHEIQLQVYLNLLPAEHGGILYEDKNTQAYSIVYFKKDLILWNSIIERCKKIMNLDTPPEISLPHNRYCPCLRVV